MTSAETMECFAVAAPGLSPLVAAELAERGITGIVPEEGGVRFPAGARELHLANLHSRIASRVLVRVAHFRANSFPQLERLAGRLPWSDWLPAGGPVRLRVTCRKSRLYHSDAVAERFIGVLGRPAGVVQGSEPPEEGPGADDAGQLILIRFLHDECTVSMDSSGALLHRRGYRQQLARAPLRETLAAAMLRASGWDGTRALHDPFCGSGTIPIEAAMMARRMAPGLRRSFAFEQWPRFDSRSWADVVAEARHEILPGCPARVTGSDRDAGAIDAALGNAARAGVSSDVQFSVRALSATAEAVPAAEPPHDGSRTPDNSAPAAGWLVTNPPYGERVGGVGDLRDLYARLGQVLRGPLGGWRAAFLAADPRLAACVGRVEPVLRTSNGGIPVTLYLADGRRGKATTSRRRGPG